MAKLSGFSAAWGFAGMTMLAGCSHSSSEVVTQLPPDLQATASVADIHIASLPDEVSPEFSNKLAAALRAATARCAPGTHPLRLTVSVTKFRAQNAAMTVLVGSSNAIEGTAQLVEPGTGSIVGDYDITRSTGGGGIIAAVAMSGAEQKMADAFAADVCKKAFGREP